MLNIDHISLDENGERHGEWIWYYDNRQINIRCNYHHGVLHGLDEGYNYDGTLRYRGYWNMGRYIGYWYYNNEKSYYLCLI